MISECALKKAFPANTASSDCRMDLQRIMTQSSRRRKPPALLALVRAHFDEHELPTNQVFCLFQWKKKKGWGVGGVHRQQLNAHNCSAALLMHIHTLKGCYFHYSTLPDLYEMLSNFIVGSKLPLLSLYFEAHKEENENKPTDECSRSLNTANQ